MITSKIVGTINKIDFTLETLYFDQNYVENHLIRNVPPSNLIDIF